MRFALLMLIFGLAGCARDDARLHGTWKSNSEKTVAAAFQKNPALTNLPPDRLERFKSLYGDLTVTYSNGIATISFRGETGSSQYHVIQRGADFVVMRSEISGSPNSKIHFVDGGRGYWIDSGWQYQEYFEKISER